MKGKRKYIYLILLILYSIANRVIPLEYQYLVYIFMVFMILYVFFSDIIFDWLKNKNNKKRS
ncbi:hypothetical protein APT62_01605 [Aerococcus urinaeequi]|uniref:hypothetical protein n=1 Tax=Aerococcus urinaeequi TaxID=51665 RepID=UPI000744B82C|nr:hypothetical protein [Aerococcus urinaeequi]ALZ87220.1 hypothetical protein APT62_01605 [Aerococcus urinaeequi]